LTAVTATSGRSGKATWEAKFGNTFLSERRSRGRARRLGRPDEEVRKDLDVHDH
jgi:hypothetical protein